MPKSIRRVGRAALFAALTIGLYACGGGSGPQTPANAAPSFSSGSSASVAENTASTVYTATASDPNGDPLAFSISGGLDAGAFALSANGGLAFRAPPNYDLPTDADGNNVYEVILSVSDGKGGSATLAVTITVTNSREGIAVKRIASDFGPDAVIAPYRKDDGALVIMQSGQIWLVDPGTGAKADFGQVFASGESGRITAAAYFNGGTIVMVNSPAGGIYLQLIPPPEPTFLSRRQLPLTESISADPPGSLFIGQDGLLYGATGDIGGALAQDAASGYGKLWSIVLDPYCGASVLSFCFNKALIGDGIRAPGGGGSWNGVSFLFDQAASGEHEVTSFNVAARPLDFGWPFRAGTVTLITAPPVSINGPSIVYEHGNGIRQGQGIVGGAVYTGAIASLRDMFVFADVSGKIWAAKPTFLTDGILHRAREIELRTEDFAPDAGSIDRPRGVIVEKAGRMLILDANGELFRVDAA